MARLGSPFLCSSTPLACLVAGVSLRHIPKAGRQGGIRTSFSCIPTVPCSTQQMLQCSMSTKPSTPGSQQPTVTEHEALGFSGYFLSSQKSARLSQFTDENSEMQFWKGTCPRSHQWSMAEPGFETTCVGLRSLGPFQLHQAVLPGFGACASKTTRLVGLLFSHTL